MCYNVAMKDDYTLIVTQAAEEAKVSGSYIRSMIREKQLDAKAVSPRLYLISKSSFKAWMDKRGK